MPEFKDISTFNSVVPVGTEKIQVSAANCVTLMEIANLGSKTKWYDSLDKRITQNKNDILANYELANQANNKAVEAMGDAESALNGVSTVRSQVATVCNSYKALSSYYNISYTITKLTLVGNNVYFINVTSIKTIILDINQWGAILGSLQDSVIYIPRRNGVGGIVEWSTPNRISGIYGNLIEVEMMVSSLNHCWVRYQVSLVKSENSSGMSSSFELIIIGTVLLPNPNKEAMENIL